MVNGEQSPCPHLNLQHFPFYFPHCPAEELGRERAAWWAPGDQPRLTHRTHAVNWRNSFIEGLLQSSLFHHFLFLLSLLFSSCLSPLFLMLTGPSRTRWCIPCQVPWLAPARHLRCSRAKKGCRHICWLNSVYACLMFRKWILVMVVRKQHFQTKQKTLKPERLNSGVWTLYMATTSTSKACCNSRP